MGELTDTLEEILDRHPAPALPVEEVGRLVARTGSLPAPAPELLARVVRESPGALRLVEGDRERLGAGGPSRWILAPSGGRRGRVPAASLAGRLRETVRALGEWVEPGSNVALARWARLLLEEQRARRVIERRLRGAGAADPARAR